MMEETDRTTKKGSRLTKGLLLFVVAGILMCTAWYLGFLEEDDCLVAQAAVRRSEDELWSDDPFWTAVRRAVDPNGELTEEEIMSAESIRFLDCGDIDLSKLRHFENLQNLTLTFRSGNEEWPDLAGIAELSGLKKLDIDGYPIEENTEFLAKLTSLEELYLTRCELNDIGFLEKFPNLTHASFYGNQIKDVSPLAACTKLCELSVGYNQIEDITPLASLGDMENLGVQNNGISDISPLKNMSKLVKLNISSNKVSDLSPIAERTDMTDLGATANEIEDISPLKGMKKLRNLALDGNRIQNIAPIKNAVEMEYLGLSQNEIEDMSPVWGMKKLFYLSVGENPAENIGERIVTPMTKFGNIYDNRESEEWQEKKAEAQKIFEDVFAEYAGAATAYEDFFWGDLNGDGRDDLMMTCQNNNWQDGEEDCSRKVFVMMAGKDGAYEPHCTLGTRGPDAGGVYGDPYDGIYCVDGMLVVKSYGGSNFRWEETDIYRYAKEGMEKLWELSLNNYVFTSGYDWYVNDCRRGIERKYAIAGCWEGEMVKTLLYSTEDAQRQEELVKERDGIYEEMMEQWDVELPQMISYFYQPNIDGDGYYEYRYHDALIELQKSPEELMSEAAEKYMEDTVKLPIDMYASEEIKQNYDHLAGVDLPAHFYLGKIDGEVSMLYYDGCSMEDDGAVHYFQVRQPSADGEWWNEEGRIWYRESLGVWESL